MEGLIETKNEYIEHMQDIITIPISKKIYEIWCDCSKRKGSIKEFQKELIQIKKWNNNIIDEEYKRIVKSSKCKYLADLIKIIIITTIKIKIYEYKDYFDNIKIKIPAPEDFVHKCYINVSIFSWKNAYLFNNKNIKDSEHQNNLNIIEENFKIIIKKTFRDFIPFNDIFQQIKDNLSENVKQVATDDDNHPNKNVQKDKNKQIPKKVVDEPEESDEESDKSEEESDKSEEESDKSEEESDKSEEESDKSEEEPDKSDESEEEPDKSEEEPDKSNESDKSEESEEESDNAEKTDDEDDVLKESKISIIDSEDSEEDTDDNNDDTEVENRNNIIDENFLRDNNNINLNNKEENGYKNEMYLSKTEDLFYKKEEKTQETKVANVTNVTNVIQEEEDRYLLPISIKGELQENQAFANKEEKYNISYKKEEAHIDEPRQQNDKIEQDVKESDVKESDVKERDVKEIHIDNGTAKSKKLKFF
jgi:hypothetical protein